MSSRVTLDEQGIVRLKHFETDLVKILGYFRMLGSRHRLEAVKRLFESEYRLGVCARLEAGRFDHVYLLI